MRSVGCGCEESTRVELRHRAIETQNVHAEAVHARERTVGTLVRESLHCEGGRLLHCSLHIASLHTFRRAHMDDIQMDRTLYFIDIALCR